MTPEEIQAAWHAAAVAAAPPDLAVWDAHTHTGVHDPDGFVLRDDVLLGALAAAGHAGAVVISSADPAGYADANDRILAEAAASGGRLLPFCRVDPTDDGVGAELRRCLDDGHRGIKLHPRSERFSMADPGVASVAAVAAERGVPVLVHAGRGIPALGQATIELLEANPALNIVLAHCGISDLSSLGPIADELPGLFFDTSWWDVTDRLALHGWVPPDRILYASDSPYGWPPLSFVMTLRSARTSGYGSRQLRGIFGDSLLSLLEGKRPPGLGPAAGIHRIVADPGLIRAHASIHGALTALFAHADFAEPLSLARLACDVAPRTPHQAVFRAIAATLDAVDRTDDRRAQVALLILASGAALTPDVAVPDLTS